PPPQPARPTPRPRAGCRLERTETGDGARKVGREHPDHLRPCALRVAYPASVDGSLGPRNKVRTGGGGQFVQRDMLTPRPRVLSSDAEHAPLGRLPADGRDLPLDRTFPPPMTRRFTRLAWTAATFTYLLIILGAIVRITGSGLGCGEHWPLCNGRLLPPLDLPTLIEYGHRLVAAAVSVLVTVLAVYAWWLRKGAGSREQGATSAPTVLHRPGKAAYVALMSLVLQVGLGAVTVKLSLPPWTVILHLGTAMLLLATLILAAKLTPGSRPGLVGAVALVLGFV